MGVSGLVGEASCRQTERWCKFLVLMECSLLLEESVQNPFMSGWEGSASIFPARLRGLEAYRSWKDGRSQPITFSAQRLIHCSLPLSLAVAATYQMVMEEANFRSLTDCQPTHSQLVKCGRLVKTSWSRFLNTLGTH